MRTYVTLALLFLAAAPALAVVRGEPVEYRVGDRVYRGYIAYDDAIQEARPGILVVHEWWGHNAYVRRRARLLARLGYTAFAIDVYGEGKRAEHPEEAGRFAQAAIQNAKATEAGFAAALDLLRAHPTTDPERTAAIGYCFGGAVVLHIARIGMDLDGVVSFHGSLAGPVRAKPGEVKAKILVCHGADDSFIPEEHVRDFKQEMKEAGVDLTFLNLEGVKHSFTNPDADEYAEAFDLPLAYDAKADAESWSAMQRFFRRIFEE